MLPTKHVIQPPDEGDDSPLPSPENLRVWAQIEQQALATRAGAQTKQQAIAEFVSDPKNAALVREYYQTLGNPFEHLAPTQDNHTSWTLGVLAGQAKTSRTQRAKASRRRTTRYVEECEAAVDALLPTFRKTGRTGLADFVAWCADPANHDAIDRALKGHAVRSVSGGQQKPGGLTFDLRNGERVEKARPALRTMYKAVKVAAAT